MIPSRPPRAGWRRLGAVLAAAGVGVAAVALPPVGQAHAAEPQLSAQEGYQDHSAQGDGDFVDTEHGPLGPADRDLLVKVKQAGLWEIPAGRMAEERGSNEQIQEIGQKIADEHVELDEAVDEVAATLGVPLPDEVYADHQVFLDRMEARSGGDFDLEFIQRLREAHGNIYPQIAFVRAGTQNDLMREFAATGEEFVQRHMDYLESSGLVDWFHIPPPPEPHGTRSRFLSAAPGGVEPMFIWGLLGVAAVAGTVTVIRTVRPR